MGSNGLRILESTLYGRQCRTYLRDYSSGQSNLLCRHCVMDLQYVTGIGTYSVVVRLSSCRAHLVLSCRVKLTGTYGVAVLSRCGQIQPMSFDLCLYLKTGVLILSLGERRAKIKILWTYVGSIQSWSMQHYASRRWQSCKHAMWT